MLKILPIFLFSLTTFITSQNNQVFLCNSPNGERYHFTQNCRGLKACKHEIIKVSLSEAKRKGKTQCGWEK